MAFSRSSSLFNGPEEMIGHGELLDFQGSLPPSSRMEHPDVQEGEQKWQKYLHLMAGIKEDGARLLRGDQ